MLIQLRGGALSKEEQERKRSEGIHYCLSTSASLETFREVLSKQQTKKAKKIFSMKDNRNYSIEEVQELLNLTKMEKRVFQELRAEEGRIISRDELCRRVWNMESNPSTQSQVSTLIKKIKDKIANLGLNSKCIKTQWGMGYMLDTSILHTPEPSLLYQVQ